MFSTLRLSDARFFLALLLPLLTLYSIGVNPAYCVVGTLAIWWGVAAIDTWLPAARHSPPPEARLKESGTLPSAYFSWLLRLYVPLQMVLIGVGCWAVLQAEVSWPMLLGIAFSVGFIAGSQGITFAHELGHSKSKVDRFCAWALMTSVAYGHFMVEHYRGHHPRAATQADPASARFGESLYRFLPRTLAGSFTSGWQLEKARLAQRKQSWLKSPLFWSFVAAFGVMIVLPALILPAQAAIKVVAYLLLQSAVAVLLLEIVNYIEHYGLQRKPAPSVPNSTAVRAEPFGMMHAWNADHLLGNSMLANLQRHSDHHMHAWKTYATLEALPGPQLPTGYAGCLLLAMVPPLWFSLMHPRIAALLSSPVEHTPAY